MDKKIIGFSQLRNERANGNLDNWARQMSEICHEVYIVDQASEDSSFEIYKKYDFNVIFEPENNFDKENIYKQKLLDWVLLDHPDADWIFWMDGDTLLDNRLLTGDNLNRLLTKNEDCDGVSLDHKNLWRSDIYYRLDNKYNILGDFGVCCFWKIKPGLKFDSSSGLHKLTYPKTILDIAHTHEFCLIHRGFATDFSIIKKYRNYKEFGMVGYELNRLIDEEGLIVSAIDETAYPHWFKIRDRMNPKNKQKLKQIYSI